MSSTSIEQLRQACLNPPPTPAPAALRAAGHEVMDAMLEDYLHLGEGVIGFSSSRSGLEALLREPPPADGMDLAPLLAQFQEKILRHAFRTSHPRFLAFIPGAPSFASILGECLASSTNFFAGVWKEAAGPAQVEILVLDWFKQFLD